jgi:flagellar biogenesis protein FliO
MAYQCTSIDQNNQCIEWVQVGFLGLPEITLTQAGQLCTAIALVLVTAWGFKKLASLLK